MELLQEAHVVFEEQAQVLHAIAKHGEAFNTETEGITGVFGGVDAGVFEHLRVNHAAAQYFQPLDGTVFIAAPLDIHLGGRLSEREVRGAETNLKIVTLEEDAQEVHQHALEVGKTDFLAHIQAFHLVEHGAVGSGQSHSDRPYPGR